MKSEQVDISQVEDDAILWEVGRRFEEKNASIKEMEFMTKKLLEMNEKSKQAEAIKGEFLSIIKNEFNNPLSNLLNLARSLETKRDSEKYFQIVKMLNLELHGLDFHFKNIFAATEIEAGETGNYFSTINFQSIFDDACLALEFLIKDKNLDVKLENSIDEKIVSDANKLYIILLNLLSNACEYSFEGKQIFIRFKSNEENFYLEVEDFGEGIKVEHHAMIFNRFSKFSSGRTRAHTGLGLGLSVSLGLAEALNGKIEFSCKEENTLFIVSIPKNSDELSLGDSEDANMTLFDDFGDGVEM